MSILAYASMGGAGDYPSASSGLTLSDSMKFLSQDGLLLA